MNKIIIRHFIIFNIIILVIMNIIINFAPKNGSPYYLTL